MTTHAIPRVAQHDALEDPDDARQPSLAIESDMRSPERDWERVIQAKAALLARLVRQSEEFRAAGPDRLAK